MHRLTAIVASLVVALTLPAVAVAHIDITPTAATPGERTTFTLTVPNERTTSATVSIAIRLPDGVREPSGVSADGWTATVASDSGHPVLRWSGSTITGDNTATFTFTATLPDSEGTVLTFPATQTYSTGQIDRWIESADAERPAPAVTLTSSRVGGAAPASSDSSQAGWLIGGTVALLVAIGALAFGRRGRNAEPTTAADVAQEDHPATHP